MINLVEYLTNTLPLHPFQLKKGVGPTFERMTSTGLGAQKVENHCTRGYGNWSCDGTLQLAKILKIPINFCFQGIKKDCLQKSANPLDQNMKTL